MPQDPVLLLVHGAYHGAWVWDTVRHELTSAGWDVSTTELLSTAEKGMPRYGLHDDARLVRELIDRIGGPIVVVAHSYGGAVVTEAAADLPNVRAIIYVAAFQLDVGESVLGIGGGTHRRWWIIDGDTLTPDKPREIFYADVPQDEADRAVARLRPLSKTAVTETLTAAAWRSIPSTYVVCEHDRAIPPEGQEQMAKRATAIRRMPTSHSPMLSRPSELSQIIAEIATAAADSND